MNLRPFEPDSRTGLELELLAPRGRSRVDLARVLADGLGARLEFGLKYYSEGERFEDGRPVCRLTPAVRVREADGVLVTLVDDNTIREELDANAAPDAFVVVMDDVRLAKWVEEKSWSTEPGPAATLRELVITFDGTLTDAGNGPEATDRYGHPLARIGPLGAERSRVAELVTRPLRREEREKIVTQLLTAASTLGFTIPAEAALHLHLDRAPWMTTPALRRLVLGYAAQRERLREEWKPNPRCRKLGPFPEAVVRVAREASDDLSFDIFATALKLAGVEKGLDLNLLGIVERVPLHPTLEVRALPMSLEPAEVLRSIQAVETALDAF